MPKLTFYILFCPIDDANSRLSPYPSLWISAYWVPFCGGTDKEYKREKYEVVRSLNFQGSVWWEMEL